MSHRLIRLHVGAHKTATTYLQELLSLNRGQIARAGCAYWDVEVVRPLIQFGLEQVLEPKAGFWSSFSRLFQAEENDFLLRLQGLTQAYRPILISDENILGPSDACSHGVVYPNANQRLAVLNRLFDGIPMEIWLSIRSYDTFLSSIYSESLRHSFDYHVYQQRFVDKNQAPEGQWTRLINDIQAAVPNAKIVLWRYEDFRTLEEPILKRYAHLRPGSFEKLRNQNVRPSPSHEAVMRANHIAHTLAPCDRALSMAALELDFPMTGENKFAPFDPDTVDRFKRHYHEECDTLAARTDLEFLTPKA